MTNVTVPLNLNAITSGSDIKIVEEVYHSRTTGQDIVFPKVRTAVIEEGAQKITFEVDFSKLNNQMSLYQLNSAK